MDLRFAPALAGLVDLFLGLVQETKGVWGRRRSSGENRDPCAKIRSERYGAEIHEGRYALAQGLDAVGRVVCRKHPAAIDLRGGNIERNLDAKLRVQMRTEVARIQQRLETTTVYVTHDQTEAMTLGDRVAVMRGGIIQQVAPPKELYEQPANLFVAGFIGSPSMNFVPAHLEGDKIVFPFGEAEIPGWIKTRMKGGEGHGAREVIAGVRPEHFEDAQVEPDRPGLRFKAPVAVVESMGSELYAYFDVKSDHVESAELVELAEDAGLSDLPSHGGDEQQMVARLSAASKAAPGAEIEMVLDTSQVQLFDPKTGRSLAQPGD